MFAHPDYFLFTGAANCSSPCITVPTDASDVHIRVEPRRHPARDRDGPGSVWVGPGVRHLGDDDTWADHTDTRPTMLTLVGPPGHV